MTKFNIVGYTNGGVELIFKVGNGYITGDRVNSDGIEFKISLNKEQTELLSQKLTEIVRENNDPDAGRRRGQRWIA